MENIYKEGRLNLQIFYSIKYVPETSDLLGYYSVSLLKSFLDCLNLKMKAVGSFETSGTIWPNTQRHIPEELNLQQYCCENLISLK
jgi:hypothetical protein